MTERTIDLEWEGSVMLTDYLITYVPTSAGGVQLEIRLPGNVTNGTIKELEPGIEYNINVYAVLNNVISIPVTAQVSTCKYNYDQGPLLPAPFTPKYFLLGQEPMLYIFHISLDFSYGLKLY